MLVLNKENLPTITSTIRLLERLGELEVDEQVQKEIAFTLIELERFQDELLTSPPHKGVMRLDLKDLPKKRPHITNYRRDDE